MANPIAAVLLALAATVPGAASVQVSLVAHGGPKESSPPAGVLRIVPVGGAGMGTASAVTVPFQRSGARDVGLRSGLVWELHAETEGWWSAPVTVYVAAGSASVTLDLWPACELRGRITTPEGEKPPPSLVVHFAATNPVVVRNRIVVVPEKDKPPFGDVTCPVKDGRFACVIAAGTLDVKVKAAGFVPHYLWGEKLPGHGVLDLRTLALKPGAALAGMVTTAEGPADPTTCTLSLKSLEAGMPSLSEMDRVRARVSTARPNVRGFFAFEGLEAGAYTLTARQPGFAPTVRAPIRVEARSESELSDPLVLERPLVLSVEVTPPLDTRGGPWTIQVLMPEIGNGQARSLEVFKESASGDGTLTHQGMAPGRYRVFLFDSGGTFLLARQFELTVPPSPVLLEVRSVPVSGTVMLGEKPLAATLAFGGNIGPRLHSDENGEFNGVLPREGTWAIRVTAADPPVSRALREVEVTLNPDLKRAELALRLPDCRLTGTVVDEGGRAVANATVHLLHTSDVMEESILSGDGGRFEFRGLASGHAVVAAEQTTREGRRFSDDVKAELGDESPPPDVRLVLRRASEVVLTVTTENGEPVAGATVLPLGDPSRMGALAFSYLATDASGTVRIPLPSEIERLGGVILPPGYAFQAFDAPLEKERTISVVVTRFGGTLELRLPSPLSGLGWSRALVGWEDGMLVPSDALLDWARVNGVAVDRHGTQFTIPQVAPGEYKLCVGPVAAYLEAGSTYDGKNAACGEGFVPRLGEATVDLRPPS
jgi:hypothetical protein